MNELETKIEKVIDFFGDKTLKFGCEIRQCRGLGRGRYTIVPTDEHGGITAISESGLTKWSNVPLEIIEILGSPIMIGDVLSKIAEGKTSTLYASLIDLGQLWQPCGLSKSLQEIFNSPTHRDTKKLPEGEVDNRGEEFMNKEPQALLDFLYSLIK